jgi:hypothetical protein
MNSSELINQLREANFMIKEVQQMEHSILIRLGCGAVINEYKTGTVMIQGKFIKSVEEESLAMLREILPPDTRWQISCTGKSLSIH